MECAPGVDTLAVLRHPMGQGVAFTPGVLFSAMGKHGNCLRMNVAQPFGSEMEFALATVGTLLKRHADAL